MPKNRGFTLLLSLALSIKLRKNNREENIIFAWEFNCKLRISMVKRSDSGEKLVMVTQFLLGGDENVQKLIM